MKIGQWKMAKAWELSPTLKHERGSWKAFVNFEKQMDKAQDPRIMDQASVADDLEPGPLKDEMLKDFDPSQETYEEYLQRKRLGERPFNMAEGGQLVKPSVDGSRPGYNGKDAWHINRDKKTAEAREKV